MRGRKYLGVFWKTTSAAILGMLLVFASMPAFAQSPTPQSYMYDTQPGGAYPAIAPYESHAPNSVVVEGLGMLGICAYSESSVEQAALQWATDGDKVVIEISPQSYSSGDCGTISQYETLISQITSYMEANAPDPAYYWGGFMLDEEGHYGFSASQLHTLNQYTANVMTSTPGISWYFTEDQPNYWIVGTYNKIVGNSYLAPQAYNTSMVASINSECSTYGMCTNMATINADYSYPWNDYTYVTGLVDGYPYTNGTWGTSYWCNYWNTV